MKRRIILHGYLAKLHRKVIEVEAGSVAEALGALSQIKALVPGAPHRIRVDGVDSDVAFYCQGEMEEIHVRPQKGGSGGKFGQIILGIVMIAVALTVPMSAAWSMQLALSGGMMVLGGLLQLLIPTPDATAASQTSKYLGASTNTVTLGTRIAYVYGTRKVGGQYLSFDVDAVDIAPKAGDAPANPDQNYFEYDVTTLSKPRAPVLPVFAAAAAALGVVPVSSWVG